MIGKKKNIIDEYIKFRPIENDIISETYRGGANQKNYIPYSISDIKKNWINYLKNNKEILIDFYIHIPFCFKKCTYCFYYKEEYNKKNLENYLDYLYSYLLDFSNIFKGIKFKSLYIGGGTPSILTENQIEKLLKLINNNYKFLEGSEKTFEGNPLSLTENKIKIISRNGINRISIGVQSLDQEVLKNSNREYQSKNIVEKCIKNMKLYNINYINIDLILGLKGDNIEKFSFTINEILKMKPSNITIYWLGPTDLYLKKYYNGNLKKFYEDINLKKEIFYNYLHKYKNILFKGLDLNINKSNGHLWNISISPKKGINYSYNDFGDGSLFSIGPSSRSHIYGKLVYKTINHIFYNYEKDKIINIGIDIDKNDEISLYIIKQIRDNEYFDIHSFSQKFGINFLEKFSEEVNYFNEKKLLFIKKNKIYFNISIEKKLYYSMFFLGMDRLLQKKILFTDSDIVFNYNNLKIFIRIYFNKKIKVNINTNSNFSYLNIKFVYLLLIKLNKIIKLMNEKNKSLLTCKKLIKNYFQNFN